MRILNTLLRVIPFILLLVVMTIGCQQQSETPSSTPLSQFPEKGNPKLDSELNQLVSAENRGEAASFAEQSNIELTDGRVRVIIECIPGQLEAATQAANNAGAKIETSYADLLQALVPITSLTTLANAESISFIRLPQQPLPAPSK